MDIRQKIERIVGLYLPATWKNSRKSATIELTNLFEREMAEMREALEIVHERIKSWPELEPNERGWARMQMVVEQALAAAGKRRVLWEAQVEFEIDAESGDLAGWSIEDADYVVYVIPTDRAAGILLGKPAHVVVYDQIAEKRPKNAKAQDVDL